MESRGRKPPRVVVAVLVAGVLALAAWYGVTDRTVDRVRVEAGLPECQGVEVGTFTDSSEMGRYLVPSVPLRRGMTCTQTYRVINPSRLPVTIGDVLHPLGGASARSGYRVTSIGGTSVSPPRADGAEFAGPAAGVDLGLAVSARTTAEVVVQFAFRSNGCLPARAASWASPTVTVSSLGHQREIVAPRGVAWIGTRDSSCDT